MNESGGICVSAGSAFSVLLGCPHSLQGWHFHVLYVFVCRCMYECEINIANMSLYKNAVVMEPQHLAGHLFCAISWLVNVFITLNELLVHIH